MRQTAATGHFLLVSIPLLATIAALFPLLGDEAQIIWAFRLHKDAYPAVKALATTITDFGNPVLYLAFAVILARGLRAGDPRRVRYALTYVAVQLVVCLLLVNLVKMGLGRPRPELGEALYHMLTTDPLYHSLPSGHTAEMTGTCLALALWLRHRGVSLFLGLLVALLGFSRVYLNQHYPSDVFFGWMFGALAGWATYAFGGGKDSPYHE